MKSLRQSGLVAVFILSMFILSNLVLAAGDSNPRVWPSIKVTPNYRNPGTLIPEDFLGLSCSIGVIIDKDVFVSTNNSTLKRLLKNLGTGTLRFGGTSADRDVIWSQANETFAGYPVVISPDDLNRLFNFAKQVDWGIILGLNLKINNPRVISDEALYASQKGGKSLIGFEIGNEPEAFVQSGWRSSYWGVEDYENEFDSYVAAIRSKVPNARFVDPATCCDNNFFTTFLEDRHNKLSFATHHVYPFPANKATIANLLSKNTAKQVNNEVNRLVSAARTKKLSLRIAETNSASDGGKAGVSDVFASSLWGVDYMFNLAECGVSGINFHIGGFDSHPPLAYTTFYRFNVTKYEIRPLYYAMLLFSLANHGYTIPTALNNSHLNIAAHSVLGADGKMYVVLINKDAKHPAWMQIDVGSSYVKATGIRLTAPSLSSKKSITLAGSSVASDGTWSAKNKEEIPKINGLFKVALPAASAVLVMIEKSHTGHVGSLSKGAKISSPPHATNINNSPKKI